MPLTPTTTTTTSVAIAALTDQILSSSAELTFGLRLCLKILSQAVLPINQSELMKLIAKL